MTKNSIGCGVKRNAVTCLIVGAALCLGLSATPAVSLATAVPEGTFPAYDRWVGTLMASELYGPYEEVAQFRWHIEDELSRGFIGEDSKEWIDLLSGYDLAESPGTIDDYYYAYQMLSAPVIGDGYCILDLFTTREDGRATAEGIHRFFDGLKTDFAGTVALYDENTGNWYYDFSEANLQLIQKQWGVGIDSVGIILLAATSAGYNVGFSF